MDEKLEYTFLQYSQPNTQVWNSINSFVSDWNQAHSVKFLTNQPHEFSIYFLSDDIPLAMELDKMLSQRATEDGWVYYVSYPQNLTKEDIEAHAFIQIIGDGYPDDFILNTNQVLEEIEPCATCLTEHPHVRRQTGSFKVNETFLTHNTLPNLRHKPAGLDLINTPNGGLLISAKMAHILSQHPELHGYSLVEVFNEKDQVSDKLFQLKIDNIILDCENSIGKICPACGSVLEQLVTPFSIQHNGNKELHFFSRDPQGLSSIYVENHIYQLFKENQIRGLVPAHGVNYSKFV